MDDFLGDEAEFGDVMDPINLKKRKFDENDTMEDEDDMNRDESMATNNELEKSSAKKTRQAEGEEDDDEEGKDEENKEEESFDISLSESEPEEEEENFDLFEKLEGQKPQSETTDVKKEEDKPNDLVKPGTSKSVEVTEKKKRLSIDNTAQEAARKKKIEQIEEENKKMQVLMANFSEEQLNRYETFRRSAFQKSSIKKIIQTVCGKSVSQSVVIAMSGISKVFVGEIVEKALDIKEKWGDAGPIQPKHLREAFRLFKNSNRLANSIKYKKSSLF